MDRPDGDVTRALMPSAARSVAPLGTMAARTLAARRSRTIRVLLVDDIEATRTFVGRLIDDEPGFALAGAAADASSAIEAAGRLRPDVVLLDHYMPGLPGIHAAPLVLAACPTTKVVMMTIDDRGDLVLAAVWAGAVECLIKPFSHAELVASIRSAHAAAGWSPHPVRLAAARAHLERLRSAPPGSVVRGLYDEI